MLSFHCALESIASGMIGLYCILREINPAENLAKHSGDKAI
jgi:hypothetical protein